MPCDPSSNNIGVGGIASPPLPGFGIPFAPITVPAPGFELPEGFPESIQDLISNLSVNWPGFQTISPNLDDFSNDVLKALASMFNMISPFLGLYNFFMALLNMILCIIEVLCALPNPFAVIRAVIRLLKTCLPAFLNIFPWFALIAMIISMLLLLLALILYIISRILALVEDLLRNLQILIDGLSFSDGESTAAAVVKIASLVCLMENVIAILSGLGAIIAVINALANIAGRSVCSGGNGQGNDSQCCTDDVCPPFIIENPDGILGSKGKLIYQKPIVDFGPSFGSQQFIRTEKWQFLNDELNQEINSQFRQIITPQAGPTDFYGYYPDYLYGDIFWPESQTFDGTSTLRRTPYVLDLVIENFNPATLGAGTRDFIIRNAVVHIKPYIGVDDYDNIRRVPSYDGYFGTSNDTGTFRLLGGAVYEILADGTETPYLIGGSQASIETFIDEQQGSTEPTTDDSVYITDITFNLKINHAALVYYDLIVYGCIPMVRQEIDVINLANGDVSAIIDKINPIFPNISGTAGDGSGRGDGAIACLNNAISKMRADITPESVEAFQADALACLDNLQTETEDILCKAVLAAIDPFQSTFVLNPDAQFVGNDIIVEITFKDKNGADVTIPDNCVEGLIELLDINATFGTVSDIFFENGIFKARISSDNGGFGEATVSFDGNVLSQVENRDTLESPTIISNLVREYQFIGIRGNNTDVGEPDDKPRRDAGDVSRGK